MTLTISTMTPTATLMLMLILITSLLQQGRYNAFILPLNIPQKPRLYSLWMSSSSPSDPSYQQSRLFGNQREPTYEEIQVMDEMINKLANAKPYDLPSSVQRAFRVISSPRFFVRIAELADMYDDGSNEKTKLITLASNLVSTLDAVVSTAKDKIQEYTLEVENVIKSAAEPDTGEFLVPLSRERMDAMRTAINQLDVSSLDGDTFLSTVDAYMNKAHQDGLDLMVGILQNVLQLYAGRCIYETRCRTEPAVVGDLFNELLQTDSEQWDSTIREGLLQRSANDTSSTTSVLANELIVDVQRYMESIILSLESGSMAQRVQAEYLQELVKRIEIVQKSL